jgi:hypothetical protein
MEIMQLQVVSGHKIRLMLCVWYVFVDFDEEFQKITEAPSENA